MNIFYETLLRNDIFPDNEEYIDIVMEMYEKDEKQRHYIMLVLEDYIHGGSKFTAYKYLRQWVILPFKRWAKKSEHLDEEFKEKMR
ncbi:MAG: hypothetical protein J6V35_05285 [Bacteroidales bacterium]|nr:hypothetical protein [Bacteroidales bacterium]MBO7694983.1 hypothetical protein [Methanobrevibacter sp.]